MRKRVIAAAVVLGALLGPLAGTAHAGPSTCKLMEKIGVRWVKECEEPSS